jgi:uncharacterized damage-inducible protein DinB
MNADGFRHLYEYHFTINRKIWDEAIVPLTDEQFLRTSEYSMGSIRNQVVHMMNIDDRWFSGLRGEALPDFLDPKPFVDRQAIRQQWDGVEEKMRGFLATMRDEQLLQTCLPDDPTPLWQVLQHVANHGTDHRAQVLSLLNQVGGVSFPQDYIYFVWENQK